jgi:hypothetical protein
MNNPDHISEGLETIFKFFDADPGSGIRDGQNSDPGSGMEKIWIRDKHLESATLTQWQKLVSSKFFNKFWRAIPVSILYK